MGNDSRWGDHCSQFSQPDVRIDDLFRTSGLFKVESSYNHLGYNDNENEKAGMWGNVNWWWINTRCMRTCVPGTHFTNDFFITIQMWWKFHLALIQLLMIISQQHLAHATTAQLSCHVPNIWIVMEKSLVKWVPDAGIKDRDKQLHTTVFWGCNFLFLPLIPPCFNTCILINIYTVGMFDNISWHQNTFHQLFIAYFSTGLIVISQDPWP